MLSTRMTLFGGLLALAVVAAGASGDEIATAGEAPLAGLVVEPERLDLNGSNRQRYLLVTGKTSDGRLVDVSRAAHFAVADDAVARVDGNRVAGVANGETRLLVSVADRQLELPVSVRGFDRYPPVHFTNDIVPLLSKL